MPQTAGAAGWRPRVWAPQAQQAALQVGTGDAATVRPLSATDDGWWQHPDPLPHGTDYAFVIDGGNPLPDPRSPWQPAGVHAPSRVFDTGRHTWADTDWRGCPVHGRVIYELHIGTFTPAGTLDAAIKRLDYLVDLGIDVVELMPVNAFAGRHGWGYDGVCWYAVHEPYGGPAALQRFVDAAHQRGLAVCLDVVYNHLGPSGNYLDRFGPYFTERHSTPWGPAVNLDGEQASEVRAFIIDNACRWLRDFHLDALRLDAVHALIDDSPQHLLAELAQAVEALAADVGRPLSLIAESDENQARTVTPVAAGGLGMQAQWADDVHHSVHALLSGERHGYYSDFGTLDGLEKVVSGVFLHDGCWSSFRRRSWGAPVPADIDGHHFVVFASDHDQIGNRALGDRPAARLTPGELAMAATLIMCLPYTPMLFMGEEWGASTPWQFFTDHQEPWLAEAIRQGRASEFGDHGWADLYGDSLEVPDPQAISTLEASRLDWDELAKAPHRQILSWYQRLIALRRQEPALASADRQGVRMVRAADNSWFVVHRAAASTGGAFSLVFSLTPTPCVVPLTERSQTPRLVACWDEAATRLDTAPPALQIPGRSVALIRWD